SVAVTQLLTGLSLPAVLKVVHSVIDSMNRRRVVSLEILKQVDGPEDAAQVAEIANRVLKRIESDEKRSIETLPKDAIRQYADLLLSTANAQAKRDLPPVDEGQVRALLSDLRKSAG